MAETKNFDIPEKFQNATDVCGNKMVLKLITKEGQGSGRASKGSTAKIHYTGMLTNGDVFDSSVTRGEAFETPVGESRVIKGWDEVMPTMAKGEKADVLIQSDYAYGDNGSPPNIPGKSALIFEMEMLDWSGEDISEEKDKSITKEILISGSNDDYDGPQETAKITIDIEKRGGELLENLTYFVGEEGLHSLHGGLKIAIKTMKQNEKAEFKFAERTKWNPEAEAEFYTVTLHELERKKSTYEMSEDEKYAESMNTKARASQLLKEGFYPTALDKYDHALELIAYLPDTVKEDNPDLITKWADLKRSIWLNCALVEMKQQNQLNAISFCQQVLESDPENEKATYRMADAMYQMKDFTDSAMLFKQCLEINPENKAAKRGYNNALKEKKAYNEAEKKKYSKMFG